MKNRIVLGFFLLLGSAGFLRGAPSDANQQQAGQTTVPPPTPYAVVARDGNSQVWQQTVYEQSPSGDVVTNIHRFIELATGLNHMVSGQWTASSEEIAILPNGTAAATNGQHQAYFPGDIYQGQIEMVTPDGLNLNSRPLGLSYFDGTNTVMLAELTNSIGQVLGANQVIYTNAFTGFAADLRYTYTMAGFEQDIILREQPPTPESLGLNPGTARLQVLTEFFSPPQPTVESSVLPPQAGLFLTDETLDFGVMRMIPGRAFMLGENAAEAGAKVDKQWVLLDGRQFLVEEVPVDAIAGGLATLPLPGQAGHASVSKATRTFAKHLKLPPQHLATKEANVMFAARAKSSAQGLVLDYQTVNGNLTNFTFQADLTYYISGQAVLYGTTTIDGGTVIKFAQASTGISAQGTIACNTSAYRPAVLTAADDNSVGEQFGSGSPNGVYSSIYLTASQVSDLEYLRISYANCGVEFNTGNNILRHSQFVKNGNDVVVDANTAVGNCLFENSASNTLSDTFNANEVVSVVNTTFHDTPNLLSLQSGSAAISITNSLLIGVTNWGYSFTSAYNYTNISDTGMFQVVGGGSHYLANSSPYRNAGTTGIDPVLLASLRRKTTYPPATSSVFLNATITNNLNLTPLVVRDTNAAPDLGYHYDPLDYVFSACYLYTNLNATAGTAIGFFDNTGDLGFIIGISLKDGANLTLNGTASAPCWVTDYRTVQEGGNGNWLNSYGQGVILIHGSGASPIPQINATFTKWPSMAAGDAHFQDPGGYGYSDDYGTAFFSDCEFYTASIGTYRPSYYFTNCLFFREQTLFWSQRDAASCAFQNCTFYDGFFALCRYTSQDPSFWNIQNTAFDGTAICTSDNFSGSSTYTYFNYNAYNTGNSNWWVQSFGYPVTNTLEVVGPQDVFTNSFNWQSSWFGNYYLPSNSLLINAGSTNANYLGLYHFTITTNQVVEGTNIVSIGYHYVGTDTNGIPLDTNGDGVPDYLEDANGNGLVDNGEIGWNILSSQGFKVFIARPRSGGTLP